MPDSEPPTLKSPIEPPELTNEQQSVEAGGGDGSRHSAAEGPLEVNK